MENYKDLIFNTLDLQYNGLSNRIIQRKLRISLFVLFFACWAIELKILKGVKKL